MAGKLELARLVLLEKEAFKQILGQAKLISNGYGTSTVPLRLGAHTECHVITIKY